MKFGSNETFPAEKDGENRLQAYHISTSKRTVAIKQLMQTFKTLKNWVAAVDDVTDKYLSIFNK